MGAFNNINYKKHDSWSFLSTNSFLQKVEYNWIKESYFFKLCFLSNYGARVQFPALSIIIV